MQMTGESKISMTSSRTRLKNSMTSSEVSSECGLSPHRVHTGSSAVPADSSGYAAIAACECPGTSISGITVTPRVRANATISRRSSCV